MNITELAILKKMVGNNKNDDNSDGMTIKKITFTDRPSCWDWLKKNFDKALRCVIGTYGQQATTVYNNIAPYYGEDEIDACLWSSVFPSAIENEFVSFQVGAFVISPFEILMTQYPKDIALIKGEPPEIYDGKAELVTDKDWQEMSLQVTFYYMG